MSDVPELNTGDEKSPDDEGQSLDWLEQLASEPDAIWGAEADDAVSSAASDREASGHEGQDARRRGVKANTQEKRDGKRAQVAVQRDPDFHQALTIKSSRPSRVQVRSLIQAIKQAEESANAADFVDSEADNRAVGAEVPPGPADATQHIIAEPDEEPPQGAQPDKSHGPEETDSPVSGDEFVLEMDDLMWLDDMDRAADMNMNPQQNEERHAPNEFDDSDPAVEETGPAIDAEPDYSMNTGADQVPDDPDEAIAWLERLAARQGALPEELPTMQNAASGGLVEPGVEDGFRLSAIDAGEIPEDPDEAMAWLEMLAAKELEHETPPSRPPTEVETVTLTVEEPLPSAEPTAQSLSADLDEALGGSLPNGLDEALSWLEELTIESDDLGSMPTPAETLPVVEEPPTPAVAHDLDEALAGAELLFAEPEPNEVSVTIDQSTDELQFDEAEDAMAWLEKLAARQGAPIEELTTIDEAPEEQPQDDRVPELLAPDDSVAADVEMVEAINDAAEPTIAEAVAPVSERSEVEMAEDLLADLADSEREAALWEASAVAEQAVALEDLEEEVDERETVAGALEELADIEAATEINAGEDLAWLDTLGAVDAEKWLAAEAVDQEMQAALPSEAFGETGQRMAEPELVDAPVALSGPSPEGPGSEILSAARRAMETGEFEESLARYSTLIEGGQFLAFLIDDLESISEQRGSEPGLQRVLGDAYARNGQLRKALESYREALANL